MDQVGLQRFRRRAQIVFQASMESLNPRMRIGDVLREFLMVHGTPRGSRPEEVRALLERVGLPPGIVELRPHELSAGQRQRVGIARALAVSPELVVLDEPVSALDVSVRAQVMNLLLTLQSELALTYLFISHDLAVVHHMSDRITVVHEGKVVEEGPPDVVLQQPAHPYTRALTDSALPWTVRM
jgi:ABC-type glutathione transport system ATPase component